MFVVMERTWSYDWENFDPVFANKSENTCIKYINENGGYEFTETFKSGEKVHHQYEIIEVDDELDQK